jgi:hypothetical protein
VIPAVYDRMVAPFTTQMILLPLRMDKAR